MKAEKNHIPLISIKEMTRGYLDSKRVLFKKFNRELEKGDFTVITGKSGTGKSTLMKFLIWQIKPHKKTVYYKMEDMAEFSDAEIQRYRRKIWIIFQDYQLISSLSPKENVVYPLVLEGLSLAEIKKKYDAVMNRSNWYLENGQIRRINGRDSAFLYFNGWLMYKQSN